MERTVVIAGGGPAGLMLAAELGLAGVDAVVLEKLPEPPGWSRALGLHWGSIEALNQRGLAAPVFEYQQIKYFGFGMLRFSGLSGDLVPRRVPQRRIEQLLEERVNALAGVELRRGHAVVGMEQDADGVTVRVSGEDGEYDIRASYLVGCDGGGSTVRKLAGIGFPGTASTTNGITGDLRVPVELQERWDPQLRERGLFAYIPLDGELVRVTAAEFRTEPASRDVPPTLAELTTLVERIVGEAPPLGEAVMLSRFGSATRQAEKYREGRVFLVGDAVHIHFPIGGQGLNTSIQDALNLGWKLAAEIQGWAPPGLLDTYQAERHPIGERVCMNTRAQLTLMEQPQEMTPLREMFGELLALDEVSEHLIHMMSGVDIRYPMRAAGDATEDAAPEHPLTGLRVPNAALLTPAGPTDVARTLHGGRGVLYDLSGGEAVLPDVSALKSRVDTVAAEPVTEIDAPALLVRPDGYIAWAGSPEDDAAGLDAALRTWFGAPAA
ncbi:FAD-dependent monooxygenase [Streptomyces formicae]|uniref:Putative monooxygenase n=1 Tax=Streptomyces formicae TaxID=1616117 RepID=A0A291Q391_9ACTN|nr:FAD-dependent monooxygenase [Streptomyces formicae]ATL26230.1 putative monooxygenase [Streptomyces formicae]